VSDEAQLPGAATEGDHAAAAKASVRPTSIEQRRRLVAESLQVGNLGNNARDLPVQADPTHDCQIELSVEDIHPYEHNPRRANNTKFNEIKASIRASGLRNPFTVTRRPGESHFVVEAGGNTRLLAIRQLWAETREPRFHKLGGPVSAVALGKSRAHRPPHRERAARRHELLGQGQRHRRRVEGRVSLLHIGPRRRLRHPPPKRWRPLCTPSPRRLNATICCGARAPSPMSWVSATVFSRRRCRPPASGSLRFQILAQQHRRGNVLGGCSQVSAARSTARRLLLYLSIRPSCSGWSTRPMHRPQRSGRFWHASGGRIVRPADQMPEATRR
jgi:hypothetical protein